MTLRNLLFRLTLLGAFGYISLNALEYGHPVIAFLILLLLAFMSWMYEMIT